MRRARFISFFAITAAASAAIIACSLQDGGVLDLLGKDAETTTDATTDTSVIDDSGPPPTDAPIVDAGATFCDLALRSDASFFFCADFDEDAAPYGFGKVLTDGGDIAFVASDASAPNLFETTLANSNNDNEQNAVLSMPFAFADAGDAGMSFFSIAFDLRVNAIAIDGAAPMAFSNTFVILLAPRYAIYAPIIGKPNVAPVFDFGAVDLADASNVVVPISDGGTPVGEWNRYRFMVQVAADGGPSTLSVYVNAVLVSTQVVNLSPDVFTSRQIAFSLGPSAIGPLDVQYDFDNVVIRSDKF